MILTERSVSGVGRRTLRAPAPIALQVRLSGWAADDRQPRWNDPRAAGGALARRGPGTAWEAAAPGPAAGDLHERVPGRLRRPVDLEQTRMRDPSVPLARLEVAVAPGEPGHETDLRLPTSFDQALVELREDLRLRLR